MIRTLPPLAPASGRIAATAWLLAACTALFLAVSAWRVPIQVSDSLGVLLDVQRAASLGQVWTDHLHSSETMLRPLRYVKSRVLLDLGRRVGSYHATFRGYHAVLAVLLVVLFTLAVRPRDTIDLLAFAVALTVLVGHQTFRGTMMEAYPTNHFLEIAVCELVVVVLSQGRSAWWRDAAALVTFAFAALTLESGLLLWVTAVAGYVLGWRGLSRAGLVALTLAIVAYGGLRVGYLHMHSPVIGDRPSGIGTVRLSATEQVQQFGEHPARYYAYNVASAIGSVLCSEPQAGISGLAKARAEGVWSRGLLVRFVSSIITTALVLWCGIASWRRRSDPGTSNQQPEASHRSVLIPLFGVVLLANAVMSFAYLKDEIISVSGVLYAAAVFVALRAALDRLSSPGVGALVRGVATLALVAMSLAWSFRALGLHYHVRAAAFDARNEWARAEPPADPAGAALFAAARAEALRVPATAPVFFPARAKRWWGDR